MSQAAVHDPRTALWNMSSPLRVMVIEDSIADAELNLHELQRAGFQCRPLIVRTHAEFLAQFPLFPFDIVLADYHLPGWPVMEGFLAMRQAGREIPFILVTKTMAEEVAVECIRQGVTDCVPHDFNNIIGAILGWAELGEERAASGNADLLTNFNKIHLQCDRATALIRELLALARR
jgi:two-component system sensor histidine kinase UhpB